MLDELEAELEKRLSLYKLHFDLNAFISVNEDYHVNQLAELKHKDSNGCPLFGVFIAVKDNIATCKLPTTAGTPALR
jgi:Asp-tRNA(Asn)/Glu-tRNA(Gln) amidotransferase A subunit family amidase